MACARAVRAAGTARLWLAVACTVLTFLAVTGWSTDAVSCLRSWIPPTVSELRLREARRYLHNRTLDVVTIQRPPFTILTMSRDGKRIIAATGFCFDMLTALMEKYSFRISLHLPYDGNWGSLMANGTWNGMVGMVNRSEVSLGVAGFTITHMREEGIDFTRPYYEEPSAIMIPPPRAATKLLAVIQPFSWKVWVAVALMLVLICPVFLALERVGDTDIPKLYPHSPDAQVRYLRIQWYLFAGLLAQGSHVIPTNTASRLLLGVWWLVAITLIACYTGTLIAFLTVPKVADHIDSLEDLVSQSDLSWTYRLHTSHDNLFSTSESEIYHQIGARHADKRVNSDAEGIAAVLSGHSAFIKEKSYLDFALDHDFRTSGKCRMKIAKKTFFTAGFGWILETGSPVKDLFDLEFLRMSESGLFNQWRSVYWPRSSNCSSGAVFTERNTKPLLLADVVSSLTLYLLGVLVALLTFLLEMMLSAGRRRRQLASGDAVGPNMAEHTAWGRRSSRTGRTVLELLS